MEENQSPLAWIDCISWRDELEDRLARARNRAALVQGQFAEAIDNNGETRAACSPIIRPHFQEYSVRSNHADEILQCALDILKELNRATSETAGLTSLVATSLMHQELEGYDLIHEQIEWTTNAGLDLLTSRPMRLSEALASKQIEMLLRSVLILQTTTEAVDQVRRAVVLETCELLFMADDLTPAGLKGALSSVRESLHQVVHGESLDVLARSILELLAETACAATPFVPAIRSLVERLQAAARACALEHSGPGQADKIFEIRKRLRAVRDLKEAARQVLIELQSMSSGLKPDA